MTGIIIGIITFIAALAVVIVYNRLVKLKNMVEEGWSGIDVQLKKRYDLIPNLLETVKGYASHEKEVFENVTRTRTEGINAHSVKAQEKAENKISQALGRLFAVAENYPDLKASSNFQNLQEQLSRIENDIQMSRRYYNGTVRENNIYIESFPSNLIAGIFSFKKADYFELEKQFEREAPKVSF